MTLINRDLITKVYEISSLYELLCEQNQLSEPSLLIVYLNGKTVIGKNDDEKSAVVNFCNDSDFITAAVCEETASNEIVSIFDFSLADEEVDAFTDKLFKDKTKKQIHEINACFKSSGKASAEKILEMESKAFYRLMAKKNGGTNDEL